MYTASEFDALVSGQRRDLRARLLRGLLRVAEGPYRSVVQYRNWRYDTGRLPVQRVAVPVISVGNLTLGGTGKTPTVAWLCRWFRQQGVRVAIVSRGYGAHAGSRNDEARELEDLLPDVPHVQDADRVAAAQVAVEELATQLIVLDDGFQHRRLGRDLEMVLIDATSPFGYDHVFPRGALREPVTSLRRADIVALSRADLVSDAEREKIAARVRRVAPQASWAELTHQPQQLRSSAGQTYPLSEWQGRPVLAFSAIGNPAAFRQTLSRSGFRVEDFRDFPDHHPFQRQDIEQLIQWTQRHPQAVGVVCTQKDLVKLGIERLGALPLRALAINLHVSRGEPSLLAHLSQVLQRIDRTAD